MTQTISRRSFEPGTTGWTVDDLLDPEIQWLWSEGRHELVDGVLATMAPQGIQVIRPLSRLRTVVERHLNATNPAGMFYHEVDMLLRPARVARPDMIFLTTEESERQERLENARDLEPGRYHPVYIPPLLVVESISLNHERHDRVTKREWYAESGVLHYWLLTAHERSLVCLVLDGGSYLEESSGQDDVTIHSRAFGGIDLPLADLWSGR